MAHFRTRSAPLSFLVLIVWLVQLLPARAFADEPNSNGSGEPISNEATNELVQERAANRNVVADKADQDGVADLRTRPKDPSVYRDDVASQATPQDVPLPPAPRPVAPQISLPQGAAKLRGMGESFSSDPSTGIASFHVPFELLAARGGVQPSLGLSYSSAGGHGIAGVGWGIGVATITRQIDRGVPKYDDQGAWHPEQDRFVFGADELVPICVVSGTTCTGAQTGEVMPAWASGWQYFRARVEGAFLRFFWSPNHQTWRIQDKGGGSMELGVPLDGSNDTNALEADPQTPSHIYAWHITRQYDAMGNANPSTGSPAPVNVVVYKYAVDQGTSYLTDIFDTPPAANAASAPTTAYAHHTHLNYEPRADVSTTYRRGWQARVARRLKGVDVTSHDFQPGANARALVRRYHVAYESNSHVSLLNSVQVEGRCDQPTRENTEGLLPPTTCSRLPALTFGYQRVAPFRFDGSPATPDLVGYEGFDERVHTMDASPPHSINETLVDLFDINSDGLPDVLVTDPARFGGKHGVFFNGASGQHDHFGAAQTISVDGVAGADANVIKLGNANIAGLDVDGDGVANLLHMPRVKTYSVYTPTKVGGSWSWQGRTVTTASQQSPKVDFVGRNADIRQMDVNADGLIDLVYTGATEVQTFLALGRYPNGDAQYGKATWTSNSTAQISNDPLTACIPWSALPIRFSDPDVRIADMNGDGFPDIVRVRHGDIRYWPGRGNGFWGTGNPANCAAGTFGQEQHVAMTSSPVVGMIGEEPLLIDDVNGDGLADLIKVRFNAVDIYLNVDGISWTPRHVIERAPPNSTITNRVRLVDVNGSGTPDILWGDGFAYKYIDLAGGSRPWVLTTINNGLGASTSIEYETSIDQMLAAEAAGQPWTSKAPTVAHVVSRVTVRDNLDRVGRPSGAYVTEYKYRDAVFEGRQREFRGFRSVRVKKIGDNVHGPTSTSESTFLLGECVDEPGATGRCDFAERWRDNPREALKGHPVISETFDENGVYLSTDHTTYRLRRLYTGIDGREVRHAFATTTDSYRYDTTPFVVASSSVSLPEVDLERTFGVVEADTTRSVPLRSSAGRAHLVKRTDFDRFGNSDFQRSDGCVEGCNEVDEAIINRTVFARPSGDASGWLWRLHDSWVQGSNTGAVLRRRVTNEFDARGLPIREWMILSGTLPLDRFHEVSGKSVAPAPAKAVGDGSHEVFVFEHDAFGTQTAARSPAGRCVERTMDTTFAQLVVEESVGSGYTASATVPAACGSYEMTSFAEYDRGLGALTKIIGHGLQASSVNYDVFGRVSAIYLPDPAMMWLPSAIPSQKFEYYLPTDGVTPFARVRTQTQDGASATTSSFQDAWTYVDGLGRTIVSVSQADTTAGDLGGWIVSGNTEYNVKGAAIRAHLSSFFNGDPSAYPLSAPVTTRSTRTKFDAFGRVTETFALTNEPLLRMDHHAMSTDAWDAADREVGGPHEGTPSTTRVDGHGRTVSAIQRARVGGQLELHETSTRYLPTGQPTVITRTRPGSTSVVRWMQYDSFGRMVLNVEPNTTKNFNPDPNTSPTAMKAWRYAYDRLGQLVGTSDPRGCGVNVFYLPDGRVLGKDYSPCRAEHADYSAPDLTIDQSAAWPVFVKGDGLEVLYRYDGADPDVANVSGFPGAPAMLGPNADHIASVSDRGSKTIFHHDGRGRPTATARLIAKPGAPSPLLAQRYAPHWYTKTVEYDGPGRPIVESTGADVSTLLGSNSAGVVTTQYSKRGTVMSVDGSYGALVTSVTRDADGLIEQITYGDLAQTNTSFLYDLRQRVSSVLTQRGPPGVWSSPPSNYSPAPNPGAGPSVFQTVLENYSYGYDVVDNPTQISDLRDPAAWPASFKPSTRQFQYDDLYRLKQVTYSGNDDWVSPHLAENTDVAGTRVEPSPHVSFAKRVASQTYQYDAVGNTTTTDDDAHGFYDRSLGTITNGTTNAGPYQLKQAAHSTGGARDGQLTAAYDDGGNLSSLSVSRSGPCLPSGAVCKQRFAYEWDEVGNLTRARRWDTSNPGTATDALPSSTPAAELRYSYAGEERVIKTAIDSSSNELHSVYIFGSLELRRTRFLSGDYERTHLTEAPYLFGHGVRLARLYYAEEDLPTLTSGHLHVLFELPDHLGSSSFIIDKATSELVEATRYQAYGAVESDYRPDRWNGYREHYKFTGKEEDIEVGLTYFGARFFSPYLNRWTSPDPLALHVPGEADLNVYAYVHGQVLRAVDLMGFDGTGEVSMTVERPSSDGRTTTTLTTTHPGASHPDASQGVITIRPSLFTPTLTSVLLDALYNHLAKHPPQAPPPPPTVDPHHDSTGAPPVADHNEGSAGGVPTDPIQMRPGSYADYLDSQGYRHAASSVRAAEREEFTIKVAAPIAMGGVGRLAEGVLTVTAETGAELMAGGSAAPETAIIGRPFRLPDPVRPPNAAATQRMSTMRIDRCLDCSDIAEDLLESAGSGHILRAEPLKAGTLEVLESNGVEGGMWYHEAYSDGAYVFDPRMSARPIPKGDWVRVMRALNPGGAVQPLGHPALKMYFRR